MDNINIGRERLSALVKASAENAYIKVRLETRVAFAAPLWFCVKVRTSEGSRFARKFTASDIAACIRCLEDAIGVLDNTLFLNFKRCYEDERGRPALSRTSL